MMQVKNFHIFVEGRVQGVGYRRYSHKVAVSLGLKGWVRNLKDGRVEIKATGDASVLDLFLSELRDGPFLAKVTDLQVQEMNQALDDEFEIHEDGE